MTVASAGDDVVLEVRGLSTHFRLRSSVLRAVDDVDFELRRGRTTCIVGESGSGKSVTARSVLNMVPAPGRIAAGRILFHQGRTIEGGDAEVLDLARLGPRSAAIREIRGNQIAMIFQEPMSSLSPVHTIGAQIVEAIRLHQKVGRAPARARAIELLGRVEIPKPEQAVDRYPFEYSGGMRQRAMIAMALSCRPSVLIADEPTTALDVTTQAGIIDLIRELQAELGMAVMFITHDMGVVAEIADDVVVMHDGKVRERGDVRAIFHQPAHAYTRGLLDSVRRLELPAETRLAGDAAGREPMLRVESLSLDYPVRKGFLQRVSGAVRAVDDVSFELAEGESLGIVGESGSGKTTLGRCIVRALEPTSGALHYRPADGEWRDLARASGPELQPLRREIRMIFQDPFAALNPRMTVEQIVAEPLLVNGVASGSELSDRVAALLRTVGLAPEMMERYPHAFSGGQRQRIVIARAIALEPRLVVADEPTSALDVSIRSQVLDLLLDLQSELGLSFVLISHDMSVIRYFCDRIGVMYRGRIVELGETERVIEQPEHAYTRALLSAVPHPDPERRSIGDRIRYDGGGE